MPAIHCPHSTFLMVACCKSSIFYSKWDLAFKLIIILPFIRLFSKIRCFLLYSCLLHVGFETDDIIPNWVGKIPLSTLNKSGSTTPKSKRRLCLHELLIRFVFLSDLNIWNHLISRSLKITIQFIPSLFCTGCYLRKIQTYSIYPQTNIFNANCKLLKILSISSIVSNFYRSRDYWPTTTIYSFFFK